MKKYFNLFDLSQKVNYKTEILAGLTVAMTMIPESLMFAILAGFSPLVGLYGAFIMGLVTAIFGGRPGLISGGAGATVVVLMALMASHGLQYVFGAIVLAGVFQLIVGILKLGKFIRLVPQPVMFGFVNGLAIIIFMAQMDQFKDGIGDVAVNLIIQCAIQNITLEAKMLDSFTAETLARAQFAFTVSFHIVFPALSIGLASFLMVLQGFWLKTGKDIYIYADGSSNGTRINVGSSAKVDCSSNYTYKYDSNSGGSGSQLYNANSGCGNSVTVK